MRRTKAGHEPIEWDDALDEAAAAIARIQRAHGDDAVAVYLGNPNVHNTGPRSLRRCSSARLHTKNRNSATSVDQLPHMLVAYWMFGHQACSRCRTSIARSTFSSSVRIPRVGTEA
jgi:hypothetical protein